MTNCIPLHQLEHEAEEYLMDIRADRQPTNSGIMLLTAFLSTMLHGSDIKKVDMSIAEYIFWITHNSDGTLITPIHENTRTT